MGGHGALVSYLRNPGQYKSVSAFSPICNPMNCRWGQKCFTEYLGANETNSWAEYDSTELMAKYVTESNDNITILIDQGSDDEFLAQGDDKHNQLLPQNLVDAAVKKSCVTIDLRMQEGFDHSYYFIAAFVDDHLEFHAQHLQ